ncbi:MAG: hypothetical protein Q9222_006365 [Ikaeria aurantiellina]
MCSMSDLSLLPPNGISYAFDHRANGYSRGEGLGLVVLKPLLKALEDGDTIRAIIRATGSNQDGRTPGITQPDVDAQIACIRNTYRSAGLSPRLTRFFEAHGTGTALGDPIEVRAINEIFGKYRSPDAKLVIGALKSNIGHLEGASGIAGFIKTIRALESGIIPRNIWFHRPNPQIPLDEWDIEFPLQNLPWPSDGLRRASVNSFGFGASNCHAVVDDAYHYLLRHGLLGHHNTLPGAADSSEEASGAYLVSSEVAITPESTKGSPVDLSHPVILVVSSADSNGVQRLSSAYRDYISTMSASTLDHTFLRNLAFTLGSKRSHLTWRSYAVVSTPVAIGDQIQNLSSAPVKSKSSLTIGFVFTGQGAHWSSMGEGLLVYPLFRQAMVNADRHLREMGCTWSLLDELRKPDEESNLGDPAQSQPKCTALQIALVKLLRSWSIEPAAVVGHSSGEIAAAYCSGAITDIDALRVAYFRGVSINQRRQTMEAEEAMMAVGLPEIDIQRYIKELDEGARSGISIGCINRDEEYWIQNLISPVRFAEAAERLLGALPGTMTNSEKVTPIMADFLVEIGPSSTLKKPIQEVLVELGKEKASRLKLRAAHAHRSSIQGVVGSANLANYACGNVYQDTLALHRVRSGQKALSLDIGLMRSVGVVAERKEVEDWLEMQGYMGVEEEELHAILDYHCDPDLPVLSELQCQVVTRLHTPAALKMKGIEESPWLKRPMFSHLRGIGVDETRDSDAAAAAGDPGAGVNTVVGSRTTSDFVTALQSATTMESACDIICDALTLRLATSLGVPQQDIDVEKPAFMHGADSLSAIGISHWLEREAGSQVSVFEILDKMSVRELSRVVAGKSGVLKSVVKS